MGGHQALDQSAQRLQAHWMIIGNACDQSPLLVRL
jgi:hypothetical protein